MIVNPLKLNNTNTYTIPPSIPNIRVSAICSLLETCNNNHYCLRQHCSLPYTDHITSPYDYLYI